MKYKIYCDGSIEPVNPGGIATFGYIIYLGETLIDYDYGEICRGEGATNNVAEYSAVIKALENENLEANTEVIIYSDSQLVVNTMSGTWGIHKAHLRKLANEILALKEKFRIVYYKWIPREQNFEADNLSRKAYLEI